MKAVKPWNFQRERLLDGLAVYFAGPSSQPLNLTKKSNLPKLDFAIAQPLWGCQIINSFFLKNCLLLMLCGCTQVNTKSVLVIGVDHLPNSKISCSLEAGEGSSHSGFRIMCEESARFTHAHTTSVLSVPAISSILTGLYPYQTGVRMNGSTPLLPIFENISERLLRKNIKTSFFSGGAPVWRRTGLNQGFELFDDNITFAKNRIFRPFSQSSNLFLQWATQERTHRTFSMIYVPDLLYETNSTSNSIGELRNLTYESQVEEFDEALFQLIEKMKKAKTWDNTLVVLVGLNGRSDSSRPSEIDPLNLHWENTQIPLFIKPWRKQGELPSKWKIDESISLADLGWTLFDIFDEGSPDEISEIGAQISLKGFLTNSKKLFIEKHERTIPLESGWAMQNGLGANRVALLKGNYLYIHDRTPKIYNTLADHMETNPIAFVPKSSLADEINLETNLMGASPWEALSPSLVRRYSIPFSEWMISDRAEHLKQQLLSISTTENKNILSVKNESHGFKTNVTAPQHTQKIIKKHLSKNYLTYFLANLSLNLKDWNLFFYLGKELQEESYVYLAERSRDRVVAPFGQKQNCFQLLNIKAMENSKIKECDDPLFLDLVYWIKSEQLELKKDVQKAKFLKAFRNYQIDQNVYRLYLASNEIWQLEDKSKFFISLAEITLSLPEYRKYYQEVLTDEP